MCRLSKSLKSSHSYQWKMLSFIYNNWGNAMYRLVPSLQYNYALRAHCLLRVTAREHLFFQREQLPCTFKNGGWVICLPWEGSRESFAQLSGSAPAEMQTQDAQTTWRTWSCFYSFENSQPKAGRVWGGSVSTEIQELSPELTPESGWGSVFYPAFLLRGWHSGFAYLLCWMCFLFSSLLALTPSLVGKCFSGGRIHIFHILVFPKYSENVEWVL